MQAKSIAILLFAALSGCEGQAGITQAAAAKIASEAQASFTSGDTAKIMQHYAPSAVMFDAASAEPTHDRALQTHWTDQLVALHPRNFDPGKVQIQLLGPKAFVASGIASIEVATPQGYQKVHVRYSDVYQKQEDGQWRIVHEHNSAVPETPGAEVANG